MRGDNLIWGKYTARFGRATCEGMRIGCQRLEFTFGLVDNVTLRARAHARRAREPAGASSFSIG
jgi:hypothetical protein